MTGFAAEELAAINDCLLENGDITWRVVDVADALGPAWPGAVIDPVAGRAAFGGGDEAPTTSTPPRLGRVAYLLAPPADVSDGSAVHYPAALTAALEGLGLWPAVTGGAVPAHAGLSLGAAFAAVRAAHARHHMLHLPLLTAEDVGPAAAGFPPGAAITCHALLDSASPPAWRGDEDGGGEEHEEDASAVVVVDGLLSLEEAGDLLALMTEPGWEHRTAAPPPLSSWERSTADREGDAPTWGARPGLVERLLGDRSPASPFAALQARLCALYAPDYVLAFSPGEACDAGLTSLVANAVCAGDPASYHLDADPACLDPAGAWAALYGLHPNRTPGAPLLASAIVYLQDWDVATHNGETLFLDEGSGLGLVMAPQAGRVVLMEGDVPHRISPPSAGAPGPRYSLVLKLVLHPTAGGSDAGPSTLLRPAWGPPLRIGTAGVRGPVPLV
jgi:probable phosphoglycerate mutase